MSWKVYKPGQGYWTRLVTGLAGGVLVAAGSLWLWNQFAAAGVYMQAIVAIVPIAAFGLLLYRWTCLKAGSVDFLIATEGEMKKVNWPSRREVVGSTWIVIVTLFLLVAILFISDQIFGRFFSWIGVLDIR